MGDGEFAAGCKVIEREEQAQETNFLRPWGLIASSSNKDHVASERSRVSMATPDQGVAEARLPRGDLGTVGDVASE